MKVATLEPAGSYLWSHFFRVRAIDVVAHGRDGLCVESEFRTQFPIQTQGAIQTGFGVAVLASDCDGRAGAGAGAALCLRPAQTSLCLGQSAIWHWRLQYGATLHAPQNFTPTYTPVCPSSEPMDWPYLPTPHGPPMSWPHALLRQVVRSMTGIACSKHQVRAAANKTALQVSHRL